MAAEYEQKDVVPDQVDQVDQQMKKLGVDDEQPEKKIEGTGALPRGIASYNAADHHQEFGQRDSEPESAEAPPSGDGAPGYDDVPDVEPMHKLHSEDEPLPAPAQTNGLNDVGAGGDGEFEQGGGGDDEGVVTGAHGESAVRSSEESDVPVTGYGEQETAVAPAIAAADEQPSTVTDGAEFETPAAEEKSTMEEDRDGGVNPAGGVGDDGGDSTETGGPDGGPSTEAHGDDESSIENASATGFGEREVAVSAAEEQPSNVTDGTGAETKEMVVAAAEEQPYNATDATEAQTPDVPAAEEQPCNATDGTEAQAPDVPAAEEQPYNATDGTEAQAPDVPAAEEQPNFTDGTEVETGPPAEEKHTPEEDRDVGVKPGSVGDDGGNSTVGGDGGASTGAAYDEPSFEDASATGDGEQEKTAAPAAPADEQATQVTDGIDVETPAAEEKPAETHTAPVVDDNTPAAPPTPGATAPTTDTTEEEPPKKEGFFAKLMDKVTHHHHHPKSAEENNGSVPDDAPHPKKGLIEKIKEKISGDSE